LRELLSFIKIELYYCSKITSPPKVDTPGEPPDTYAPTHQTNLGPHWGGMDQEITKLLNYLHSLLLDLLCLVHCK
jgi:hypothetical protein